ncbi:hypothetical protein ACTMU2_36720 [Cupriavidus basilensis]
MIKLYLTCISLEELDERDGQRWTEIISLTINLEHRATSSSALIDAKEKKIAHNLMFSEAGDGEDRRDARAARGQPAARPVGKKSSQRDLKSA